LPYTVLGGASIGAADGVGTHVYKNYYEKFTSGRDISLTGVVEDGGKKL